MLVCVLASSLILSGDVESSNLSLSDNATTAVVFDPKEHSLKPGEQPVTLSLQSEENETVFENEDKRRQRELEELEYRQTLASVEEETAKARHREQVEAQGREFSKHFLALNLYDAGFPEQFQGLLKKFPLAGEDKFCRHLIKKGRRIVEATGRAASAKEPQAEKEKVGSKEKDSRRDAEAQR